MCGDRIEVGFQAHHLIFRSRNVYLTAALFLAVYID